MKDLVLKQLLQVMDVSTNAVSYDLLFGMTGRPDLRLPVSKETAEVLIGWLCEADEQKNEEPDVDDEETEEEDEQQEFDHEADDVEGATIWPPPQDIGEDDVASL